VLRETEFGSFVTENLDYVEVRSLSHIPPDHHLAKADGWRATSSDQGAENGNGENGNPFSASLDSGGHITDICVHYAAAVRKVLGALQVEPSDVAFKLDGVQRSRTPGMEHVRPFDTFHAMLTTSDGVPGSWLNSFAFTENLRKNVQRKSLSNLMFKIYYNRTNYIAVDRYDVELQAGTDLEHMELPDTGAAVADESVLLHAIPQTYSVEESLKDFANAIFAYERGEMARLVNTPVQAFRDLQLIDSIMHARMPGDEQSSEECLDGIEDEDLEDPDEDVYKVFVEEANIPR